MSSSGHLVLGGALLGLEEPHLAFDVVVHVATLLATLIFYRDSFSGAARDGLTAWREFREGCGLWEAFTKRKDVKLMLLVVVGSLPTGLMGFLGRSLVEELFGVPAIAAWMLLLTAGLLLLTPWARHRQRGIEQIGARDALLVGLIQGFAIIPGISRSGSTIACALLLGFNRELAARFSFLLSVPAILGASVLMLPDLFEQNGLMSWSLGVGFVTAALSGLGALVVLIPLVRRGRLHYFALYLVPAALLGLVLL